QHLPQRIGGGRQLADHRRRQVVDLDLEHLALERPRSRDGSLALVKLLAVGSPVGRWAGASGYDKEGSVFGWARVAWLVLGAAVALVLCASFAAPASGSVTLGSNLSDPGFGFAPCSFSVGCTVGLTGAPGGVAVAPFDGVVVRWRFLGDGGVVLRVLH